MQASFATSFFTMPRPGSPLFVVIPTAAVTVFFHSDSAMLETCAPGQARAMATMTAP